MIDEEFPYPLNTGKRIRTFSLTKALAGHNEVAYLAYGSEKSESFNFLQDSNFVCYAVPPPDRRQEGPKFYLKLLGNLFSPLPYIVTSHYTKRFERRLHELQTEHRFDIVICEWTPYAIFIKELRGAKSIIVAHNIEAKIWRRYEQNETNTLKKAYIKIQRNKVEAFEKSCFIWSNGAISVSDAEAAEIASYGVGYKVQTVENGVDINYFQPLEVFVDPNTLVFTGAMDWRPNQDAVKFFVREILPLVKKRRPEVKIAFVGRMPPKPIRELGRIEGVTVTGTVEDVRPYIAAAALYVVPLRIGGGSRLKILEAMAMKKPVLSTTVGAEGLNVTAGKNILLAEGPEQFAGQVVSYLDNPERLADLAAAGRQLVEEQYRWEKLGEKLHHYLSDIMATP